MEFLELDYLYGATSGSPGTLCEIALRQEEK